MSYFLAPIADCRAQFFDAQGRVLNGGLLYSYAATSTTPQNTYTDSTGGTANQNPIQLNSDGRTPYGVYLTSGLSYKFVLTDSVGVVLWTQDVVAGIGDVATPTSQDEWVAPGLTPTYVSATSFTLAGDQTTAFHKGRRLKTTNSGGTIYSTIVGSAFGALTTITMANDSGSLDSGLSAVSYSLLSATNPAVNTDMTMRKGTAVASAATTDIWSIAGNYVHVTGVVGISSFGTAPYAGARRTVIHDGAVVLTNGTNLKLPGDQDLTVAANSVYDVIADTTTAFRVVNITHAFSRPAGFPAVYISGLTYANNAGDATNDLDIAIGSCRDSTNAMDMLLTSSLTKQSDAAWAVGTAAGGLDTGAVGNSDYYIWLIKRSDTGVVDALYSLSSTAPTMPTSYDYKRLIGWFKRTGGTIVAFHTYEIDGGGLEMRWDALTQDIALSNTLTTARRTDAVKVPLNFSTLAILSVQCNDATTNFNANICCPDQTDGAVDPAASAIQGNFAQTNTAVRTVLEMWIRTSATGTIAARANLATVDTYVVVTLGFRWARRN